jgi:hypothetical protein
MVSDLAAVDLGQFLSEQIQNHFSLGREGTFGLRRYVRCIPFPQCQL